MPSRMAVYESSPEMEDDPGFVAGKLSNLERFLEAEAVLIADPDNPAF